MKTAVGRYALVMSGSLVAGAALFALSFIGLDFVWTHVVATDPKQVDIGDGVVVVGGGSLIGCTLGLAALIFVLYRFWPRRISK